MRCPKGRIKSDSVVRNLAALTDQQSGDFFIYTGFTDRLISKKYRLYHFVLNVYLIFHCMSGVTNSGRVKMYKLNRCYFYYQPYNFNSKTLKNASAKANAFTIWQPDFRWGSGWSLKHPTQTETT